MSPCYGLEQTYHCCLPAIKNKQNCLITFIHWKLTSVGFLCVPNAEANAQTASSELLPYGWSDNLHVFEIFYIKDDQVYVMKAIKVNQQLIISVLNIGDETVGTVTLELGRWIGSNLQSFGEVFIDKSELNSLVERELIKPLIERKGVVAEQANAFSSDNFPPPSPTRQDRQSKDKFPCPPVGRGDLDPLAEGEGGGMLMNPIHDRRRQPVPEDARFDPFEPVFDPDTAGETPRSGDPDPDHQPPPGSSNM